VILSSDDDHLVEGEDADQVCEVQIDLKLRWAINRPNLQKISSHIPRIQIVGFRRMILNQYQVAAYGSISWHTTVCELRNPRRFCLVISQTLSPKFQIVGFNSSFIRYSTRYK
jgi:hypothetical protein